MRRQIGFLLFTVLASSSLFAQQMGASYRLLAFTGQTAPGGGEFGNLNAPVIGADGTVAFTGGYFNGETFLPAVFAGRANSLRLVAKAGQSAPGGSGEVYSSFESVSVGPDGNVAFNASTSVPFSESEPIEGIYVEGRGEFSFPDFTDFAGLGPVSFRAGSFLALKGSVYGEFEGTVGALLQVTSSGVKRLVEADKIIPQSSPAAYALEVFDSYPYGEFFSWGVGQAVDASESGSVALKLRVGPSPSFTPPPVQAIYAGKPGALKPVARSGDPAPGLASSFVLGDLSPAPSIASNNLLAFGARYEDVTAESSYSAVFSGSAGALRPIVKSGDPVPTASGVVFEDVSQAAVVNETGDVVFKATIRYPNETSRQGIWIQRQSGSPVLIAVSGIKLPTPTGERIVSSVDFAGPATFNDLHQFVFRARFSNGESTEDGIYVADTRPLIPWVRVSYPRKARDRVTRAASITIRGQALDDTGIEKVEYTAERTGKKRGKAKSKTRRVAKLAKGDRHWSFRVPLALGNNRISVTATDKLGNVSEPLVLVILRY